MLSLGGAAGSRCLRRGRGSIDAVLHHLRVQEKKKERASVAREGDEATERGRDESGRMP